MPEQIFSIILERDKTVHKWLKPGLRQFKIIWKDGLHYNPDFVVETDENTHIIELKSSRELGNNDVQLKAKAAQKYNWAYLVVLLSWLISLSYIPKHYFL